MCPMSEDHAQQPQAPRVSRRQHPDFDILGSEEIRVKVTLWPTQIADLWFTLLAEAWGTRPLTRVSQNDGDQLYFDCSEAEIAPLLAILDETISAANDTWRDKIVPLKRRLVALQPTLGPPVK